MAHPNQILNELMDISKLVAKLPVENPYKVPSGYFENLSADLIANITALENDNIRLPLSKSKYPTPFVVPPEYFDELATNILKRIKIQELSSEEELVPLSPLLIQLKKIIPFKVPDGYFEGVAGNIYNYISLKETTETEELEFLSPLLAHIKKEMPFNIPEGYFEGLAGDIHELIALQESTEVQEQDLLPPFLVQLKKELPFKLPEGYFEEFPSDIIAGVNAIEYVNQELEAHLPMVNDFKIQNVYQVPDGYFDNLGEKLLGLVKNQRKSSIISLSFNKRLLRYGMAALVAGAMAVGAWMFYQNKSAGNAVDEFAGIKKISNDEMLAYLDNAPETSDGNTGTAYYAMNEEDVQDLLTDVPDEELQQYLNQHAEIKDVIIN